MHDGWKVNFIFVPQIGPYPLCRELPAECKRVPHTLVMERNDTVIAVFSPLPPGLSRARIKSACGQICVCACVWLCAKGEGLCVSYCRVITLSSDLQREQRRHNQAGSHTHVKPTNSLSLSLPLSSPPSLSLSSTHTVYTPQLAVILKLLFPHAFCAHALTQAQCVNTFNTHRR